MPIFDEFCGDGSEGCVLSGLGMPWVTPAMLGSTQTCPLELWPRSLDFKLSLIWISMNAMILSLHFLERLALHSSEIFDRWLQISKSLSHRCWEGMCLCCAFLFRCLLLHLLLKAILSLTSMMKKLLTLQLWSFRTASFSYWMILALSKADLVDQIVAWHRFWRFS